MKGRTRKAEFRLGNGHGIEGVNVEDVEAATSVHQYLCEALFVDDGVDDERVASRSRDVGRMVPLIEGDQRFQPAKEGGDGRLSGVCLPVAHLVLALGADGLGSTKDHDAFPEVREVVPILAHCVTFLGCYLFAVSLLWSADLSEETFKELIVLVEVFDGVGVVGAWAIHELVEVVW